MFTCRDPRIDWTRSLAEAFAREHETWYVWLRRRPVVRQLSAAGEGAEMSFAAFLRLLRGRTAGGVSVYINSTETPFPLVMLLLRWLCGPGIWCLDMYDDLLYGTTGPERLRRILSVRLQIAAADIVLRAADELKVLFPRSFHYGNASHVVPVARSRFDYGRVLVMASFDERFDFTFMGDAAAACPAAVFHLYGQVAEADPAIQLQLEALLQEHSNLVYHGAYRHEAMEGILADYAVSFAPYRSKSRLTRYIDPLRYYACLNSGMELITTDIPQAHRLGTALHLIETPAQLADILDRLSGSPAARRNTPERYTPQSWADRAATIERIVGSLPRTLRLERRAALRL